MRRLSRSRASMIVRGLERGIGVEIGRCLRGEIFAGRMRGCRVLLLLEEDVVRGVEEHVIRRAVFGGVPLAYLGDRGPIPTPWLYELLFRCLGRVVAAVEVGVQGVRAFLYGNDILLQSVERLYPPIKRGGYVAVIDPADGRVIGVARALYDYRSIESLVEGLKRGSADPNAPVFENVFDLGCFVRGCRRR